MTFPSVSRERAGSVGRQARGHKERGSSDSSTRIFSGGRATHTREPGGTPLGEAIGNAFEAVGRVRMFEQVFQDNPFEIRLFHLGR